MYQPVIQHEGTIIHEKNLQTKINTTEHEILKNFQENRKNGGLKYFIHSDGPSRGTLLFDDLTFLPSSRFHPPSPLQKTDRLVLFVYLSPSEIWISARDCNAQCSKSWNQDLSLFQFLDPRLNYFPYRIFICHKETTAGSFRFPDLTLSFQLSSFLAQSLPRSYQSLLVTSRWKSHLGPNCRLLWCLCALLLSTFLLFFPPPDGTPTSSALSVL